MVPWNWNHPNEGEEALVWKTVAVSRDGGQVLRRPSCWHQIGPRNQFLSLVLARVPDHGPAKNEPAQKERSHKGWTVPVQQITSTFAPIWLRNPQLSYLPVVPFTMSLTPDQLAYQMAHIHQDRGPYLIATTAVLSVLSTAAIYLRFLVRWRTKVGFKTDDYAILMAGVSRASHRTMRYPMLIQT